MAPAQSFSIELHDYAKTVDFYLAELEIFLERLKEVAERNTSHDVTSGIESFQNQFIIQKEVLQLIRRDVHRQQDLITAEVKTAGKLNNLDVVDKEFLLRERMQTAEKILLELKHSFYRFLSKVL